MENDVQELRARVKELENSLYQAASAEERSRRRTDYVSAMELLRRRDQELFEKRMGNQRAVLGEKFDSASLALRAMGQDALLAAAQVIGEDSPDVSVSKCRVAQLEVRGRSVLKDLKENQQQAQLGILLKLLSVARDGATGALLSILEVIAPLMERGVRTQEDVGALLSQRENLQQVVDTLELQNRHLEPLLAASNLSG
nr:MAG: hypothetical protein DIU62_14760 [Pseudomonadota bacterium]